MSWTYFRCARRDIALYKRAEPGAGSSFESSFQDGEFGRVCGDSRAQTQMMGKARVGRVSVFPTMESFAEWGLQKEGARCWGFCKPGAQLVANKELNVQA